MMTVITRVALRVRIEGAHDRPGWIGGQLLIPADNMGQRVIVGTWESRADWQAWHEDAAFQETRELMEGLQEGSDEMEWLEVVTEGRERVVV
jgi:heme-degrading monooxygenase HmoA